jgi:UDP-glucose 4-epimerase
MDYLMETQESIYLNLGTEKGLSVLEIFEKAQEVVGYPIPHSFDPRRLGDPVQIYASSSLARKLLDWKPVLSDLDSLIKSTYQVYKANEKKHHPS